MKWVKKSSGVLWIAKEIFKIIIQFMIIWPTATTNAVASFVLAIRALVAAGTTGMQTAATLGATCNRKRRHVFHLALTRATWIVEDQKDQEDVTANLAEKDHLCFSISLSKRGSGCLWVWYGYARRTCEVLFGLFEYVLIEWEYENKKRAFCDKCCECKKFDLWWQDWNCFCGEE